MLQLILAFCFTLAPAASDPACESALRITRRFERTRALERYGAEQRLELTRLLNEVFTPVMIELARLVAAHDPGEWRALGRETEARTHVKRRYVDPSVDRPRAYAGRYPKSFQIRGNHEFAAPFGPRNRAEMKRLLIAATALHHLVGQHLSTLAAVPSLAQNRDLIDHHTFNSSFRNLHVETVRSVLRAAAQLTQEPAGDLTPDEQFRRVMRAPARGASLAVQLVVMLPPRVLGRSGMDYFIPDAIESSDQGLTFRPEFKAHLLRLKRKLERPFPHEFNFGCPVAHRRPGADESGLQIYLDALMSIYERMPDTSLKR